MITVGHSIGFQRNLAHEQTTLSPTIVRTLKEDQPLRLLLNLLFYHLLSVHVLKSVPY